jgi:hypothetical protein
MLLVLEDTLVGVGVEQGVEQRVEQGCGAWSRRREWGSWWLGLW